MMPTVRLLTHGDIEPLVTIALRAWEPVFASLAQTLGPELDRRLTPDWRASQEQAVRDACADDTGEVWVAESDGQLVGFLTLSVFDAERAIGEIGMLAVDPEAQAQGIGLALTAHGTARLRQRGMQVALVETGGDPGHAPARRTYDRAGFTRLPIARFFKPL